MKRGILSISVIACGIVFCALASITNSSALTYESEVDVMFTWAPIINITVSDDLIIESLPASSSSDSNIIDVSASSNSINGYYLYSTVGDTNNPTTDITYDSSNASASNAKFASIDGNKADFTAFGDNQWGYSYSKDAGSTWVSGDTDNTSAGYNALPLYTSATGVKLIENTGTTGTTALKFKIGAKASSSQDSGLYTNVVNFIGVPRVIPVGYTINFYDPSGEATTMPTPNPQTGITTDGAVVIDNTTPIRTNYLFKGWCDVQTSDETCSGNKVLPGSTYALGSASASVTVNLYAMWKLNVAPGPGPTPPTSCTTPVPNLTYMQDLNSSNKATVLSNMTEDSQYYLADKRDDKAYCVAKLKDGNIWMTQNLDHDIKTDGSVTYDSTTTDITATWTPSTATYPTSTTTWNGSDTAPESYDPGELYWSGTPGDTTPVSTGNSHYHLGNYYNWTAAIAMNNSSSYTTDNQDANQSICPANWTLPKSGNNTSNGSFQYLVTQYGWNDSSQMMENPNIWNTPIKTAFAGVWDGSLYSVGGDGGYWSSVVKYSDHAYTLYADDYGSVNPSDYYYRYIGWSVRCVAR